MNYLKQIRAFDSWEELNPLPDKSYRLWYKLMAIANNAHWPDELSVPVLKLQSELHTTSKQTVINARNALVQAGRIQVTKGKHGKAALYRIIPFPEDNVGLPNGRDSGKGSGRGTGLPNGRDSGTYIKQNKTKQNDSSNSNTHTHEDVFNFWQQKLNWGFPNGIVMADLTGWITEFGPDLVIFALTIAGKKQVTAGAADSFLSSVFNSWRQQHISTLEQAQKANESHEKNTYNQRQQRNYYRKRQSINEPMPECFKKQQEQEIKPQQHTEKIDDSGDPMPND